MGPPFLVVLLRDGLQHGQAREQTNARSSRPSPQRPAILSRPLAHGRLSHHSNAGWSTEPVRRTRNSDKTAVLRGTRGFPPGVPPTLGETGFMVISPSRGMRMPTKWIRMSAGRSSGPTLCGTFGHPMSPSGLRRSPVGPGPGEPTGLYPPPTSHHLPSEECSCRRPRPVQLPRTCPRTRPPRRPPPSPRSHLRRLPPTRPPTHPPFQRHPPPGPPA